MTIDESFCFKTWLREEMKARHWNIYDLSIESGLSEKTIADYLRDARLPKLSSLLQICKAFGKRLIIQDEHNE